MNAAQAAEYLGYSTQRLYILVRTGQVPARKIGRTLRFIPSELDDWAKNLPKAAQ